ncbi:MAG: fucose isomerase [Oscillospiraceae bacterium]|nr:fucose isomerase [Oscillospiraceae bacterium]
MLKHIPKSFTPELMKLLMETGHGDEIIISDGNFPHDSMKPINPSIYIPNCSIVDLLGDILRFFPLDMYVDSAAYAMDFLKDNEKYGDYAKLIEDNGSKLELVDRFKFYELAKGAFGIIVTSDTTKGGNILIKKGTVSAEETV